MAPSKAATVAAAVAAPVPQKAPWWADPAQDPWRAQDGEAIPGMAHEELSPLEEEVNGEEGMAPPQGVPVVLGPSSNGFGVQPTMGSGCGPTVVLPGWPSSVRFPGVVPPMNACLPPLLHRGLWHPGVYQPFPPGVPAPGLLPGHAPVPLWHPSMISPCCGGCQIRIIRRCLPHKVMDMMDLVLVAPTTPEGPVRPKPSSRKMPLSQPPSEPDGGDGGSDGGGDDDPNLPEGPEAPSLRSSTVATSEVRSMLKRRARREDQQSLDQRAHWAP